MSLSRLIFRLFTFSYHGYTYANIDPWWTVTGLNISYFRTFQ